MAQFRMTIPLLPDEILSIICNELGRDREFQTLFNCALSSRTLADPALRILYQLHELSPAFLQPDEENVRQINTSFQQKWQQAEKDFRKWTLLWRCIVASSLDSPTSPTYKPYCRYLRTLDLRNLVQMLEDPKFSQATRAKFFESGLESFYAQKKEGKRMVLDLVAIVNSIGEAVVPQTFQLEEISGNLRSDLLARWIPHTPRLKSVVVFQGDALTSDVAKAISENCENFQSVTIREWRTPDADETFAEFLNEVRPDCLRYFEMISVNSLQGLTFKALGRHHNLIDLKLGGLSIDAILSLDALKDCTGIETLLLEDNFGVSLQNRADSEDDNVLEAIVSWLSSCHKLRDLTVKRFVDGAEILGQVLLAPGMRLKKLCLEFYTLNHPSSANFHTALAEQQELESLSLKGNGQDAESAYLSIMVEGISKVVTLRELMLRDISDEFEDQHIINLALNLINLEEFWTSGDEISEDVLMMLASLPNLKVLTLLAITKFTRSSIIQFIHKLDQQTQQGFALSLMAQHSDFVLTEEDQDLIKSEIGTYLEGRFDYALWRDPDSDDSDDD